LICSLKSSPLPLAPLWEHRIAGYYTAISPTGRNNMKHYQSFIVRYHGNSSRVSLTDDFGTKKYLSYNYSKNNACEIAADFLIQEGYAIIGYSSRNDCYIIFAEKCAF
jgi:hypothetical protein